MYRVYNPLKEKLVLIDFHPYVKLVSEAYLKAPLYQEEAVKHWIALRESTNTYFKRMLSRAKIIFTSENLSDVEVRNGEIRILGKKFELIHHPDPYESASQMTQDFYQTGTLKISIDYSTHPIFTIEENISFRCVHDYVVHILGGHPFGAKGEIASYNRHAKIAPPMALPALFTEIVGQAAVNVITGSFPVQKIAILEGFDYKEVGKVEGYQVVNKKLVSSPSQIL